MLLVNNLHWQASQKLKTDEILSARASLIFIRVTRKMHSFSANPTHIIFSVSAGYCWWTSEVLHVVMVSLVHFSWTSEPPLVLMIFLVHFSLFLLILHSKSALACLDGKFLEEVFPHNLWLCTHITFTRFTNWTSFPHHFTTNQSKQKLLSFGKEAFILHTMHNNITRILYTTWFEYRWHSTILILKTLLRNLTDWMVSQAFFQ